MLTSGPYAYATGSYYSIVIHCVLPWVITVSMPCMISGSVPWVISGSVPWVINHWFSALGDAGWLQCSSAWTEWFTDSTRTCQRQEFQRDVAEGWKVQYEATIKVSQISGWEKQKTTVHISHSLIIRQLSRPIWVSFSSWPHVLSHCCWLHIYISS